MTAIELQSRKMTNFIPDEEGIRDGVETSTKVEDVIGGTPGLSSALHSEADSSFQILKVAKREYCFVRDTSSNVPEDVHDLDTDYGMYQNVSLTLADTRYKICSSRLQIDSVHALPFMKCIEHALRSMSSLMAFRAQAHIGCSNLMSFPKKKSFCRQIKRKEDVKSDPKRAKQSLSHAFGIENQPLIYTICLIV